MPCRRQPYIWISDDALAQAYRRFANTCAVRPGHGHSRRNGSHVPGPLEARKRQAKRRMVGLAMGGAPPAMPDFAAVFDFGSFNMTSLWKPPVSASSVPNSPAISPPATPPVSLWETTSPLPSKVVEKSQVAPQSIPHTGQPERPLFGVGRLLSMIGPCPTLSCIRQAHTRVYGDDDRVPKIFAEAAFVCLLKHAEPSEIIQFLQSDLNTPEAHKTHAYLVFLCRHQSHFTFFSDYVQVVCDKVTLGTISEQELHDIIWELHRMPDRVFSSSERRHIAVLRSCRLLLNSFIESCRGRTQSELVLDALYSAFGSVAHLPEAANLILFHMRSLVRDAIYNQRALERLGRLFSSLPTKEGQDIRRSVTSELLSHLPKFNEADCGLSNPPILDGAEPLDDSRTLKSLVSWLERLCKSTPEVKDPLSPLSCGIYPLLVSTYDPSHLAPFFNLLTPAEVSLIMLHYWVKPFILGNQASVPMRDMKVTHRRSTSSAFPFQKYGVTYTYSKAQKPTAELGSKVFEDIDERLRKFYKTFSRPGDLSAYVQFLRLLAKHQYRYDFWLIQIMNITLKRKKAKPLNQLYPLIYRMIREKVEIPYSIASSVIQMFIDDGKPNWAYTVFNRPGANSWLSETPELILMLIDHGYVGDELWAILNKPEYSNSLPVNQRTVHKDPLTQDRVELMHHVAWALAKSPYLSTRQAFRRVTDVVHYLRDRGAEMSSLVSRALVFSGVVRPLREGAWVSTVKFEWILEHVRRLEGSEVAQQLDETVFALRTENLQNEKESMEAVASTMEMETERIARQYAKRFGYRWRRKAPVLKPGEPQKPYRLPHVIKPYKLSVSKD